LQNLNSLNMKIERLFDFLYYQYQTFPQEVMVSDKYPNRRTYLSTKTVKEHAESLATGLIQISIEKGDKIGLIVERSRSEWLIVDLACQMIGAILIPVYPTISEQEYAYIFKESGIKVCFVDDGHLLDKMIRLKEMESSLANIYCLDEQSKEPFWRNLLQTPDRGAIDKRMASITKEDLATIIYTSGTTGQPKGVMLTHWNIVSNVLSASDLIPCSKGDIVLSFLPLCHIFEKVVTYAYIHAGVSIVYTGIDNLGGPNGDLQTVKPHFFTAVPRLLEKVYEKIMEKGQGLKGYKHDLFFWALSLGEAYEYNFRPQGIDVLKWWVADKLIFSKWRKAMGGRVKGVLTGAAACPPNIIRMFSAAGIPIREGYGLTEAAPGISINRYDPDLAMIGTVGPLLEGVTVKIDTTAGEFREGEGEILASGPNIMEGYYQQPEKTAEVLVAEDGLTWLRTGDVGKMVYNEKGTAFLKITDRKKELMKTSGGKYVAPSPIESALKQETLIDNIMVVGEQRRFVAALIVPGIDPLRNWCQDNDVLWTNMEDILNHPKVLALYQKIIDRHNQKLARFEQIKRFKLIDAPWEIVKDDGRPGELTPTLKLKRRIILEKWASDIDDLYKE
jgi:long-chain acyl-CoA synthetase